MSVSAGEIRNSNSHPCILFYSHAEYVCLSGQRGIWMLSSSAQLQTCSPARKTFTSSHTRVSCVGLRWADPCHLSIPSYDWLQSSDGRVQSLRNAEGESAETRRPNLNQVLELVSGWLSRLRPTKLMSHTHTQLCFLLAKSNMMLWT